MKSSRRCSPDEELLEDEVRPLLDDMLLDEVVLDELLLDELLLDKVLLDELLLDELLLDKVPLDKVLLDTEVPLLLDDVLLVEALVPLGLLLPAPLLPATLELAVAGELVALLPVPVIACVAPPPCPPVAPPAPSHAGTSQSETKPANKTDSSNSKCLDIAHPPNLENLKGPSKRADDVGRGTSFRLPQYSVAVGRQASRAISSADPWRNVWHVGLGEARCETFGTILLQLRHVWASAHPRSFFTARFGCVPRIGAVWPF